MFFLIRRLMIKTWSSNFSLISILLILSLICLVYSKRLFNKPELEIFALRYGTSQFGSSAVYAKPAGPKYVEFSWMVYFIRYGSKRILIDTGFENPIMKKRWEIHEWANLTDLLERLGEKPESITHVLLTHEHYDHVGQLGIFNNAHFFIHEKAFEAIQRFSSVKTQIPQVGQELFHLFANDEMIMPNMRMFHVGGHTLGSSAIEIQYEDKKFLFPGDNCYLLENCLGKKYIGAASSRVENKAFIDKYADYPGAILPHHDSKIFKIYKRIHKNIVLIYRG